MSLGRHKSAPQYPVVWSIAGSDNCSGAGIQADIKTLTALGAHACTIVTALTAQNSGAVLAVEPVSTRMLSAQIDALKTDMPPRAVKIGMMGDAESVRVIAGTDFQGAWVVCDPVMISSSGTPLIDLNILPAMKELLFPRVDLLTPNVAEAAVLTGRPLRSDAAIEQAGRDILALGVKAVVIKGWDSGDGVVQDFYCSGEQTFWLTSPRREGPTARGTGCTFSSALAAAHAFGFPDADAAVIAKAYVNQCLRQSRKPGKGMPVLSHQPWPVAPEDVPWMTPTAGVGRQRPVFPDCGAEPLGFYPIVDSVAWLERLLPLGVATAQLRIKDRSGAELEEEIRKAVALARHYKCRLFINDYWQLAIRHGAYGVHLGQEDIATADMDALSRSNLRLGVSTHCYAELARAHALNPSYIAFGPVFPTTLKAMKFAPQGVEMFRVWRRMLDYPLVAIGGITLEAAPELLNAGADSIAVVSDITRNPEPESRVKAWLEYYRRRPRIHNSPKCENGL